MPHPSPAPECTTPANTRIEPGSAGLGTSKAARLAKTALLLLRPGHGVSRGLPHVPLGATHVEAALLTAQGWLVCALPQHEWRLMVWQHTRGSSNREHRGSVGSGPLVHPVERASMEQRATWPTSEHEAAVEYLAQKLMSRQW
jgi:hypothetical protein